MSVSIKVAVRCRPFTIDDKLGVQMVQNGDEEGEINLLNSDYTTNRFAFTYSWWSAYGYGRHITSNQTEADAMVLMNQEMVYSQVQLELLIASPYSTAQSKSHYCKADNSMAGRLL